MTEQDFLVEILANPDDDAPRLIFADWLDERGDPRGEFIRVQCELAQLRRGNEWWTGMYATNSGMYPDRVLAGAGPHTHRQGQLRSRQLSLLMQHCKKWVAPLGPVVTGVIFERGFPEGFSTDPAHFLQHAEQWYRHVPVRQLSLRIVRRDFRLWLKSPLLLNLNTLDLGGNYYSSNENRSSLEDSDVMLLTACPHLANLRRLHLGYFRLHQAEVQALLDSPFLQNLQCLRTQTVDGEMRSALEARFGPIGTRVV